MEQEEEMEREEEEQIYSHSIDSRKQKSSRIDRTREDFSWCLWNF